MIGRTIEVLDYGFVRLVDAMPQKNGDLAIVRAARVSYNAEWRAGQDTGSDERLIRYLMSHRHTSPFEAVELQFEVQAPIFVLRQWHRHRTWSYNEVSARYQQLPDMFYVPQAEMVGSQSKVNKQARDLSATNLALLHQRRIECARYKAHCAEAFVLYQDLLVAGWPRELARGVLPFTTYSHMFAKVDLKNLFDWLTLRLDPHAQYEIRVYGEAVLELIRPIVPVAVAAWEEGRQAR